jgi:hypothetical protein
LAEQGRLLRTGGKFFEVEYKTIVTKNKKLERTPDGSVNVLDKRGDNYFMITPDLIAPNSSVFNYKFGAEPTFPLSKPLMLQKINEWSANPMVVASVNAGYYDFRKIADKITELNDFVPEEFMAQTNEQGKENLMIDPQKMMEMANVENQDMSNGEQRIGTPLSTPEHTQVHLEYMKSEKFKGLSTPEIISNFAKHVMEESMAQMARKSGVESQATGSEPPPQPATGQTPDELNPQSGGMMPEAQGIMGGDAKATMPGKMLGSEMLPDFAGRGQAMA